MSDPRYVNIGTPFVRLAEECAEVIQCCMMIERFGLPERQLKTVGYGKQSARQVIPGAAHNEPGAASNRRVTFTIDATQHF